MDTNIQNIPATSSTSRQISSEFQPNFSCLTAKHKRSNEHLGINDPPEKKISYMIPNRIISLANNFYDDSHHGPFEVHIQKIFDSNEKDTNSISDIRLAKAFNRAFPQIWSQAYNLRSLGISKFTVTMHGKDSANDLVLKMKDVGDKIFQHSNWTAYIPEYRTHSRVITKDLGSSETPDEILEYLSPLPDQSRNWTAPTFIKCIRRRVNDPGDPSTVSYINTNTFMLTFKGASPPSCALYLGKIVHFVPYIQKIKRCYNCQRFGHLEEQCRGGDRARVCCNCASRLHSAENCNSNIVNCINCIRAKYSNSSHASSAFHCPVYIYNRRVKIIMAKLGLGYIDALAYFKKFESRLDDGWFNIDFKRDQNNTVLGDYIPWSNSDHSAFSSSSCDPDWPSLHPSSPRTVRSTSSSDGSLLDSNTNSSARQPRSTRRKRPVRFDLPHDSFQLNPSTSSFIPPVSDDSCPSPPPGTVYFFLDSDRDRNLVTPRPIIDEPVNLERDPTTKCNSNPQSNNTLADFNSLITQFISFAENGKTAPSNQLVIKGSNSSLLNLCHQMSMLITSNNSNNPLLNSETSPPNSSTQQDQ